MAWSLYIDKDFTSTKYKPKKEKTVFLLVNCPKEKGERKEQKDWMIVTLQLESQQL